MMTYREAIESFQMDECADCYAPIEECRRCPVGLAIESLEKLEEITKGIEDLKETLSDAYKSNDYVLDKVVRNISLTECEDLMVSFSVKVMQNLGWLLGVLDWSEE